MADIPRSSIGSATKRTITAAERLQLLGLFALAERHNQQLKDIELSIAALLGVDMDGESEIGKDLPGHIQDAVYDDNRRNVDQLLKRLNITVGSAPETPKEPTASRPEGKPSE